MSNSSAYALFHTCGELENAVVRLRTAGFRSTDISVLGLHNGRGKSGRLNAKPSESNAVRFCTDATLGGALGWLAGASVMTIPGSGLFIVAGPIMGVIAGTVAGGAAGILTSSLLALGIPRQDAGRYASRTARGAHLILIFCDDDTWLARAEDILKESGAENIASCACNAEVSLAL